MEHYGWSPRDQRYYHVIQTEHGLLFLVEDRITDVYFVDYQRIPKQNPNRDLIAAQVGILPDVNANPLDDLTDPTVTEISPDRAGEILQIIYQALADPDFALNTPLVPILFQFMNEFQEQYPDVEVEVPAPPDPKCLLRYPTPTEIAGVRMNQPINLLVLPNSQAMLIFYNHQLGKILLEITPEIICHEHDQLSQPTIRYPDPEAIRSQLQRWINLDSYPDQTELLILLEKNL